MDRNFKRLLDTLRLVPRSRKASTADIHHQLSALGYQVSRRTVQRDLEALALEYGIECDARDKSFGWRWPDRGGMPLTPVLDLPQALAFQLMERELGALMPAAVRTALEPWLAQAKQRVAASGSVSATRWLKKIAFEPLGPPLLPAREPPGVLEAVIEAIFQERQLTAEYHGAQTAKGRSVRLHPLGLIKTGLVSYLVARFDGYKDARLLALHRLRRVRLADEHASPPPGFALQDFIRQGGLSFGGGPRRQVRLRMAAEAARHLQDTPLSDDQCIEALPGSSDEVLVTATLIDSQRLAWWIRGFGAMAHRLPDAVVDEPGN